MAASSPAPIPLPEGYRLIEELARGPSSRVVSAVRKGRKVALRMELGAGQGHTELSVLAALHHPRLAALVDHGVLPGGGRYLAREWVEGEDLARVAALRTPEELGRIVARLCEPLEALHAAGFVHGDLKAANVLVREKDEPVLTDFGLARREGAASTGVSGTSFSIAPEVLLGHAADARADLFALGALLHRLLVPFEVDAREFHGRFPAEPWFEAQRCDPSRLPEWARDLVAQLVERDPAQRPGSAALVGRLLRARLGMAPARHPSRPRIVWQARHGREDWLESRLRELSPGAREWWRVPPREDPGPLSRAAALGAALRGDPADHLDLDEALRSASNLRALEHFVQRAAPADERVLFVQSAGASRWKRRALELLSASLPPRASLVVVAEEPAPGEDWRAHAVPPLDERAIRRRLDVVFEGEARALDLLAARLAEECEGSATVLAEILEDVGRGDRVGFGEERLLLHGGALPEDLGRARASAAGERIAELRGDVRDLLAALVVLGGESDDVARIAELSNLRQEELAEVAERAAEHVRRKEGDAGRPRLSLRHRTELARRLEVDPARWRELFLAEVHRLEAGGTEGRRLLPLLYRARDDEEVVREIAEEAESLRERGCPELALELLEEVEQRGREADRALEPLLHAQRALTLAVLGEHEHALELVGELVRDHATSEEVLALAARVRGRVATLLGDPRQALEHFEEALALGGDRGGAVFGKAHALYETGDDAELDALARRVDAGEYGALSRKVLANVRSLRAMSLFRRGDVAGAREALAREVEAARDLDDPMTRGALSINFATIARRTGDLDAALRELATAEETYQSAGFLPGIAQARALLGGVLRETGQLLRAVEPLASALAIRERAGDAAGSAAVRGTYGLLLAERGHLLPAAAELERAAREMRALDRPTTTAVLEARALEMRARSGAAPAAEAIERLAREAREPEQRDPRALVALARAAAVSGDGALARDLAAAALERARAGGRAVVERESELIIRALDANGAETSGAPTWPPSDPTEEDAAILAFVRGGAQAPDPPRALELARDLARRGRDDRAARLFVALAARADQEPLRAEARSRATELLAACTVGLSEDEARAAARHLLGLPDPRPEEVAAPHTDPDEELEMQVLSLLDINRRLVEQDDLPTLLSTIVESAISVTGAQRGMLVLEQEGRLELDLALDSKHGDLTTEEVDFSSSIVEQALDRGEALRLSNAVEDPVVGHAPSVSALDLRSVLCQPFTVQEGLRGAVYLDNRVREGAFDERAETLLGLLAGQAALAIRQVRRLEQIRALNSALENEVEEKESDLRAARRALVEAGEAPLVQGLIGDSTAMKRAKSLLARIAPSRLSVLLIGPSGTGKELAARAVHDLSDRADGPFVTENCAALPDSLLESELFGYKKGTFTGATADRPGIFERAHGGTLFLDEIGELKTDTQVKLLRVLETREVRRIGESEARAVDFRLVTATNRDLEQAVRDEEFREDLLYRLDGVRVEMPSLASRPEDIPALVDHFLRLEERKTGVHHTLSPKVLQRLCDREWPGNVRELANEIARLCVLGGETLDDPDLVRAPRDTGGGALVSGGVRPLAELERAAIRAALDQTDGDKRKAAELLGISRAKVYQRLKEWEDEGSE